ncbi:MAG: hypothetical protein ABW098_05725 [Candidatus Thiodiazotropha sp.]
MSKNIKWIVSLSIFAGSYLYSTVTLNDVEVDSHAYVMGKQLYTKGILPNGELVKATIKGDIEVQGDQLICETCHRRSGLGSTEGQQVVPAVAGNVLFNPLKIPISKPPEPPIYRQAYTRETLMAAIRDGIDANGKPLDSFMPRYEIDETALDGLMAYVSTLSATPSPGVTDDTIHFATITLATNGKAESKALLDVMDQFVEQKNIETRYESKRAKNAPWHKEWLFKPYRKWKIHAWELKGEKETWPAQLSAFYTEQPVFALINGLVPTGWEHVNEFCQGHAIPCLFPTTQLPVVDENDYYSIYMTKGVVHEAEAVASYLKKTQPADAVVQFFDNTNQQSVIAAETLRQELKKQGIKIDDVVMEKPIEADRLSRLLDTNKTAVIWLDKQGSDQLLSSVPILKTSPRVVLSTQFYGIDTNQIPRALERSVSFVHSSELPGKLNKLILRSTGWFKSKRIYNPGAKEIQANAYFALKVAGDAVKHIRGYFYRDYFIEKIEHMIDDLTYTSIYPRVSMAPEQRFVSRGFYIAGVDGKGGLRKLTDWTTP